MCEGRRKGRAGKVREAKKGREGHGGKVAKRGDDDDEVNESVAVG